jgi:hypothetical protein
MTPRNALTAVRGVRQRILGVALVAPLLAGDCISSLYLRQPVPIVTSSSYDCAATTLVRTPGVTDTGHFRHDHGRDYLLFNFRNPETGHLLQGEISGIGGNYSPAFMMTFTWGGVFGASKRSLSEALGVGRHLMTILQARCVPDARDSLRCTYRGNQIPTCKLSS